MWNQLALGKHSHDEQLAFVGPCSLMLGIFCGVFLTTLASPIGWPATRAGGEPLEVYDLTDQQGDFKKIMQRTGMVGVAGSGGQHSKNPRLRAVGAGAGVCECHGVTCVTTQKAVLRSAAPGN